MALFKSLNNNSNTTHDPFLDAVVSMQTNDGAQYTSAKAIKNSDVFTAVRIIASDIASNEVQMLEDGNLQEHKNIKLFNEKPNHYMDGWHFKFALACNMLLNGNSYAEIKRNGAAIESLHILPNSAVSVKQTADGSLIYKVDRGNQKETTLNAADVLHFKYFTQDGLAGVSPLLALKDELDIQRSGNKTLFNFFTKGVNGNGILKVQKSDLDKAAKEAIREKFEEANGAANGDNSLRTIILDDTMDYRPIEVNTDVLKLVNSNDWTTKQIAKVYGLATERLAVESQHSSNIQSNMMYLQNTLIHYFKVFTSELSNKLELGDEKAILRFNSERLMENDPQTTLENAIKAVNNSLISINEGREKIGLPRIEGGDRLLASLNYTHLDNLDIYQQRKTKEVLESGE